MSEWSKPRQKQTRRQSSYKLCNISKKPITVSRLITSQLFYLSVNWIVSLSHKLAERMDPLHLELSYQMALLDKRFHLAALKIAACYRGIRTRRKLKQVLAKRKWAIFALQNAVRRRIKRLRMAAIQNKAALLLQRYCRGHLVGKKFIKQWGDIRIATSLVPFNEMKIKLGHQLSNMLRLAWRIYKRV